MSCLPCLLLGIFLCFLPLRPAQAQTVPTVERKLVAAVQGDFPPVSFKDPISGKPRGFAIDVMNEVARRAGVRVEYVIGRTWEESQEMLLSGRADIIPDLTVGEARKKDFVFTSPVETLPISYIVRNDGQVSGLKGGMRVGAMRGSIAQVYLRDRRDIQLVPSDSLHKLFFDLLAGHLDIVLAPAPSLTKLALDSGIDDHLLVLEPPVIEGVRAMALRPDETALAERLSRIIDQFVGTPEYQQIYLRWWGKPKPFWTTAKVVWTVVVTLLLSGLVMGYWRYVSVLLLNRELKQTLAELEESRQSLLQSEEQSSLLAQEADRERRRTHNILESIQDGISIQDRDYRILYQNPSHIEMVGAHQGEQCYRVYQHRDAVCDGCPVEATFRKGSPHSDLRTFNGPQGPQWAEIVSSPLHDERGEIVAAIESVRDITERKRMEETIHEQARLLEQEIADRQKIEEALQENERFLRTIIDTEPECVKLLNSDGDLLMMNSAGLAMLDADSLEQVKGNSIHLLIAPEYRDAFTRLNKNIFLGFAGSLEFEMVGLKGRRLRLDTHAVPFRNDQGEIVSLLAITRDITARKLAEEALAEKQRQLEELNCTLEQRIIETLAELRRKDQMLIQQNRLAAMGEMINNIAHQWRQPLNNIGLIVQNLQLSYESGDLTAADLDDEINKTMDVIMYMSRTIDDFRNFFRQDKEKVEFVINRMVARSLDIVAATLKNNEIRVELQAEEMITAFGYQNEYAQAVLNILANARDALVEKAVADGCIAIRVTSENGRSVVTIRDNGGGIAEDVLPRIFDPYFTTKEPGKGTGIGLYMSKVIIEQNMDGRLSAGNVEGGAEFRIEL